MPEVPRALFVGLVDDAALFPPGNAPMGRALAEHESDQARGYADLVGPFLCPASRIDELATTLRIDQELRLSIVMDVPADAAHSALDLAVADTRVTLVAVEAGQSGLGEAAASVGANLSEQPGVTGYLEVPRTGLDDSLDLVKTSGWHAAKYRTGGVTADAFPSEAELAAFLVAATAREVPFKLTAGLHHATRRTGASSGFEHHGLLNVLVGTRMALRGSDPDEVAAVLAERDVAVLRASVQEWDESICSDVRSAFRSFGCCGVTDPINDLISLGLVAEQP